MTSIHSALIEVSILNNGLFNDMPALIKLQNVLELNLNIKPKLNLQNVLELNLKNG